MTDQTNSDQGGASGMVAGDNAQSGTAGASQPPAGGSPAEGEGSGASSASSPPSGGQAPEDWRDRRIAKLTAQKREAESRAQQLEAAAAGKAAGMSQADVEARARAIAEANDFNSRCDQAAEVGKATWADFPDRVKALAKLVDQSDQESIQNYNLFLSAALETGQAPQLVYDLGGDLNEANRILSLPPIRMATALGKLAASKAREAGSASEPSSTPKPLNPLATRSASGSVAQIDPTDVTRADQLSTKAWMERRNKQILERRGLRR